MFSKYCILRFDSLYVLFNKIFVEFTGVRCGKGAERSEIVRNDRSESPLRTL